MMKKLSFRSLLLSVCAIFCFSSLQAQMFTLPTAYTNSAGITRWNNVPGPQFITFSVTNTNSFPVTIKAAGMFHAGASPVSSYNSNGKTYSLWYSFTSISGSPIPIATPSWQLAASSGPITTSSNGVTEVVNGINIIIPPAQCGGNTVRFAMVTDTTLFAYGPGATTPLTPTTFSLQGVVLNAGSSTQYAGGFPNSLSQVNTYPTACIGFEGLIKFDTGANIKLPAPTITAFPNPICYDQGTLLSASSTPSCYGTPTYYWFGPGGFIGTGQTITLTNLKASGLYTCKIKTPITDTSLPGSIVVNVIDPPAPVVTGKFDYCLNEPYEPIIILGSNPKWYYVDAPAGSPIPITPTFNSTTIHADSFFITQTINGCESRTRTKVFFRAAPKPQTPKVTTPIYYCENAVASELKAQGQDLRWYYDKIGGYPSTIPPIPQTGVKDTLDFYVSQFIDGCEGDRAQIDVIVTFKPNGLIVPSRTELCQDDTISLSYFGSAFPSSAYNWSAPEGVELVSGSKEGPIVFRFTKAGTVKLDLKVGNEGCYSDNVLENIKVDPMPSAEIHTNQNLCLGVAEIVSLASYTPTIDSFFWDFDGGVTSHYSTDQGPYGVTWDLAGNHVISLIITDELCRDTVTDSIVIRDKPDASIDIAGYNDNSIYCAGDSIMMTAHAIKPSSKYVWMPARFFDTYNDVPVTYGRVDFTDTISLTVTDEFGCINTGKKFINTKPCCEVTFPSAFTPNGDSHNDVFRAITLGWREVKSFRIMNRWGTTVFESRDIRGEWDGTFNGKPQDLGTYFYSIIFKCGDKLTEQKGELTLVR